MNTKNDVTIFNNEEFGQVRVVMVNNEPYFVAKDIATVLGYKDPKNTVKNRCKNRKIISIQHPQSENKTLKIAVIPKEDLLILISLSQKYSEVEKTNIIASLVDANMLSNNMCLVYSREETEFISELEQFLNAQNITDGIRQFRVLNYWIDYYIPSIKLAIEYDENEHKHYSYDRHEGRQREIENKLGCKFIRVSDKNTNAYNLGIIMKGMVA